MLLSDARVQQKYEVKQIQGKELVRIMEMGLTPGSVCEVIRRAPMGYPIEIKIRGYLLSLRKKETDAVEVSPI
ncbi:MAG: FeoA family protein [Bacteroidetes bacterium]|jgi:Fe2+ transport system protein FeoA|nr:ferrous iron transport protein A [Balneolaceae bacterium]MDA0736613.1 FeoA family protein [Bacteroidota bacterium]MDA1126841.1 FeoA family protein [Bacteroidota bacterium]